MSTLWLHIGHDKTGSSAVQRMLALSRPTLEAQGIAYPMNKLHSGLARMGQAGFGNGSALLEHGACDMVRATAPRGVLFSHEGIFTALAEDFDTTMTQLVTARCALGLDRIRMLLFVRNPVDHAGSLYQQEVRHRRLTESPDAYFARYTRPVNVWHVLQKLHTCAGVQVQVANYSHVKDRLAAVTQSWLELERGSLACDPVRRINRGCTRAELATLRALNLYLPAATCVVARGLRILRPRARAVPVVAGYGAQAQLERGNADAMALVNHHYLPSAQCYQMAFRAPCAC